MFARIALIGHEPLLCSSARRSMGPNGRIFAHRGACPAGSLTGQLGSNASARRIFAHRRACPAGSVTGQLGASCARHSSWSPLGPTAGEGSTRCGQSHDSAVRAPQGSADDSMAARMPIAFDGTRIRPRRIRVCDFGLNDAPVRHTDPRASSSMYQTSVAHRNQRGRHVLECRRSAESL
jgi:hypothetical protein